MINTLDNITGKIRTEIKTLFPEDHLEDVRRKSDFCTQTICSYIKERHLKKTRSDISFVELIQWLTQSGQTFNERIAWFNTEKNFFRKIQEIFEENRDDEDEEVQKQLKKLDNLSTRLQRLSSEQLISLIQNNLTPFKIMDGTIASYGKYLNEDAIRSIVGKVVRKVDQEPNFENLQYHSLESENKTNCLQLTLDNNCFDLSDKFDFNSFQKHIENLTLSPTSLDVDIYITEHMNFDREEIQMMVNKINSINKPAGDNMEENSNSILLDSNDDLFGLMSTNKAVKFLNK